MSNALLIVGALVASSASAAVASVVLNKDTQPEPKVPEFEPEEFALEESEPVPPAEDSWNDIKQVKGHPVGAGSNHIAMGGTWYLVGADEAPTAEDCWKFSKNNGINNWGWRQANKSCWAYMDPFLGAGNGQTAITNHVVGCTKAGRDYTTGCEDMTVGNIVWGHTSGTEGPPDGETHKKVTLAECRRRMKDSGKDAFGYRTNLHGNNGWTATCFTYEDGDKLKGWFGNGADKAHITGCTDTTKKVRDGCK